MDGFFGVDLGGDKAAESLVESGEAAFLPQGDRQQMGVRYLAVAEQLGGMEERRLFRQGYVVGPESDDWAGTPVA